MLNFHAQMTRKSDIGKLQTASSSQHFHSFSEAVFCHLFSFILIQHENKMCLFQANQIFYSHHFRRNIYGSANALYADWSPISYTRKKPHACAHTRKTPVFCAQYTHRFFHFHSASVKGKNCPALRWDPGTPFPLKKALIELQFLHKQPRPQLHSLCGSIFKTWHTGRAELGFLKLEK